MEDMLSQMEHQKSPLEYLHVVYSICIQRKMLNDDERIDGIDCV